VICRLGCMAGVSGHHSAGWRADGVLHFLGVKLRGERREEAGRGGGGCASSTRA